MSTGYASAAVLFRQVDDTTPDFCRWKLSTWQSLPRCCGGWHVSPRRQTWSKSWVGRSPGCSVFIQPGSSGGWRKAKTNGCTHQLLKKYYPRVLITHLLYHTSWARPVRAVDWLCPALFFFLVCPEKYDRCNDPENTKATIYRTSYNLVWNILKQNFG